MRFKEFALKESFDPQVKAAQEILKREGYNLGPTGVDGILGPWTLAAIDAYQNDIPPAQAKTPVAGTANKEVPGAEFKGFGSKFDGKLPVNGPVSSHFGMRARGPHNGTDFAVPTGTPIKSPQDGVVSRAGNTGGGEGTFVIVDAGGEVHKFFHLSKILVQQGEKVKAGQTIGLSGNTGLSTGPHLHWEKHVAGRPVNPLA